MKLSNSQLMWLIVVLVIVCISLVPIVIYKALSSPPNAFDHFAGERSQSCAVTQEALDLSDMVNDGYTLIGQQEITYFGACPVKTRREGTLVFLERPGGEGLVRVVVDPLLIETVTLHKKEVVALAQF